MDIEKIEINFDELNTFIESIKQANEEGDIKELFECLDNAFYFADMLTGELQNKRDEVLTIMNEEND